MIAQAAAQTKNPAIPTSMPGRGLLVQRKCACGSPTSSLTGACAECQSKKRLQTKLSIGASNDPLEQEADRVADQVMATPAHANVTSAPPRIQRFTEQVTEHADSAPASVDQALASSGSPLEPALRQDMEQRFGHDFSRVRVHANAAAEQSAREVNAHAYTVGHDVVFASGMFAPGTTEGQRLIAHELTHVVQQSDGTNLRTAHAGMPAVAPSHSSDRVQRKPATPGVCDASNLGSLGPEFAKSEENVKKLKLPAKLLRTVKLPDEKNFVLYCPHRASIAIGGLVPGTDAYIVGSGKVKGKDEAWVRVEGQDKYYWGFINNDKYEIVESVEIPAEKITVEREKPKKGVCGPDVTKQLANGVDNVRKEFRAKTEDEKEEMCDQIDSLIHGPVTWDFARLHVRDWMAGIRDTCATVVKDANEPCCANSVQVDKECCYAGSANYVLFGVICKSCFDHYLGKNPVDLSGTYRFNSNRMLSLIESYKSSSWNFNKSKQWSLEGYKGWPSGGSTPTGDCSQDCSSNCSLPFFIKGGADNEAFRARWCPHIDPLKACKSGPSNLWDYATRAKQ